VVAAAVVIMALAAAEAGYFKVMFLLRLAPQLL
jgi:hypothetical protein